MSVDRKAAAAERFLTRAQRKVDKRWAEVPDGEGRDEALHRVRKAAKRARYTAELAEPALGKTAKQAHKRFKALQEVLGARQDQVVAADYLHRAALAAAADGENAFTYGLLYERCSAER